ncbi:MAG TPA: hypothetical protein VNJ05_03650 [Sphingomicrobium sp.]|nr:hypothetical protein [Sphingomicrobium sp.]
MRALLTLAAAAVAVTALPAGAALAKDGDDGFAFSSRPGTSFSPPADFRFGRRDGDRDRRRHRGFDGVYYIDRDYQGDSAWRSDSFNDWWHERPNRAYPAWLQRNHDCQRQWVSGNVLAC